MTKRVNPKRSASQGSNYSSVNLTPSQRRDITSKGLRTIVLYEELRLIERGEAEINGAWRGAHILLFFLAFIFGSFCTFCFHTLMFMFDDKCVLFPKLLSIKSHRHSKIYEIMPIRDKNDTMQVDFVNAQWMDPSVCYLPAYVPLVSGIFGLVWITMFLMCSTGTRTHTGLQSPWRVLIPVFLFSLAMSILCIHASTVTENGLQAFCDTLAEITNGYPCSYAVNVVSLAYHRRTRGVYQATRLTIISAWFHTMCWLCSVVLVVIRVALAVDFQLVRVRAELVGDPDLMLQRHEKHVRTVSPEAEVSTANATAQDTISATNSDKMLIERSTETADLEKNKTQAPLSTVQQSKSDDYPQSTRAAISEIQESLSTPYLSLQTDKQQTNRMNSGQERQTESHLATSIQNIFQAPPSTSHSENKLVIVKPFLALSSGTPIISKDFMSVIDTAASNAAASNDKLESESQGEMKDNITPLFINSPSSSEYEDTLIKAKMQVSQKQSTEKKSTNSQKLRQIQLDVGENTGQTSSDPQKHKSYDAPELSKSKAESITGGKKVNISKYILTHRPSLDVTQLKEIANVDGLSLSVLTRRAKNSTSRSLSSSESNIVSLKGRSTGPPTEHQSPLRNKESESESKGPQFRTKNYNEKILFKLPSSGHRLSGNEKIRYQEPRPRSPSAQLEKAGETRDSTDSLSKPKIDKVDEASPSKQQPPRPQSPVKRKDHEVPRGSKEVLDLQTAEDEKKEQLLTPDEEDKTSRSKEPRSQSARRKKDDEAKATKEAVDSESDEDEPSPSDKRDSSSPRARRWMY